MFAVGFPVHYFPHAEHDHLKDFAEDGLAAIVGRIHKTGSADLMVFVPNKEPHWQDNVPMGEGPHTFRAIEPREDDHERQDNVVALVPTAPMTGDATGGDPNAPPAQG